MDFKMEISEMSSNTVKARVAGPLDAGTSIKLEMELAPYLKRETVKCVIMDIPDVTFMSSSGLRVFMMILKALQPRGGVLFVVGADSQVTGTIGMARLDKLIQFRDSIQECTL